MVVPLPFNITIDTCTMFPYDHFGRTSARGIKARVTPVNCGGAYTVRLGKELTIKAVTTGSQLDVRCVLTVTAQNDPDHNPFDQHLVLTYPPYATPWVVYDSNTLRDDRKIKHDHVWNYWYTTSTNTIVVLLNHTYDGSLYEPTLTVKAQDMLLCAKMCDNGQRCLLPNFRCNGVDDCGDWSDERNCNPMPTCPPGVTNRGGECNAWIGWIALAGITTLLISCVLVWSIVRITDDYKFNPDHRYPQGSIAKSNEHLGTDCNPDKPRPTLNAPIGKLAINIAPHKLAGHTCEWLINGTDAWVPAIIHMDIQAMTLNSRDLLRVTTRDGKSVLYEHYGHMEPGVILLPTGHKVVRVTLTLSSDPWDRKWDVDYNTKDLTAQLLFKVMA
ncbi:unnamed protein product, partial [Medioppia subpectinata]